MPPADARNPARISRGALPPWLTTDRSFSDRTGNTQGIRFSSRPPIRAKPSIAIRPGAPAKPVPAAPAAFTVASGFHAAGTIHQRQRDRQTVQGHRLAGGRQLDGDPAVAIGEGDGGCAKGRTCGIFDEQVRIDERLPRRRGDFQTLAGRPHALDAKAGCGAITGNI